MDSLITAAARALAAGDPLGALKRVSLRDDAPALALRGIAMAQLGDLSERRLSCEELRGPSVRKRQWPARGASSPRPRSRSSHGTWAGRHTRSTRRGRRWKHMATASTPERAALTRSPCAFQRRPRRVERVAVQPRSRETSAISASATTHFARATASFGPKARAALRTRAFARTRLPSCAIAMPRSASAGASSRSETRFNSPRGSPAAPSARGRRAVRSASPGRIPPTLVTPTVQYPGLTLFHDQRP